MKIHPVTSSIGEHCDPTNFTKLEHRYLPQGSEFVEDKDQFIRNNSVSFPDIPIIGTWRPQDHGIPWSQIKNKPSWSISSVEEWEEHKYRGWIKIAPESNQQLSYEHFYLPQFKEVNSVLDNTSYDHLRFFETAQGFYVNRESPSSFFDRLYPLRELAESDILPIL